MKTGQHSGCIRPGVHSCSTGFQSGNITILTPESKLSTSMATCGVTKNSNWNQFPVCAALYGKYIYISVFPPIYRGPELWCKLHTFTQKHGTKNQVPTGFLTGTVLHRCRAIGLEINASIRTLAFWRCSWWFLANHFGMVLKSL